MGLPKVTRAYQNHHLDSSRWDVIVPRDDDIVVTTSYKSGTTWMQLILLQLLHGDTDPMPELGGVSPWVDARFMGVTKEMLAGWAEGIAGRRFFKSHLPLDGLPIHANTKYLIVARDARDVFMSFLNHWGSYTDLAYERLNSGDDFVGEPLPPIPQDPRELWRKWMTQGWFEWESEGWPFWSNLHHTQSYWDYRHLPNFEFFHYSDMLKDPERAVRRVAEFLDLGLSDARIGAAVEATSFANVRERAVEAEAKAKREADEPPPQFFSGGARTFFFKGSNGRWVDLLNDEDLALYDEARRRVLTPDCSAWLENGGPVPR
jgi:aryl sulfotransferase